MKGRRAWLVAALLLPWGSVAAAPEGDPVPARAETTLTTIAVLEVDREMSLAGLRRTREALRRWQGQRDALLQELSRSYTELDRQMAEASLQELEKSESELRVQENRLRQVAERGRELRHEMVGRMERLGLLDRKIADLTRTLPADTESVTGTWEVRFEPTGEAVIFDLIQTGALVRGEYAVSGGGTGSVQGTLVKGRIELERIDSQHGRLSDLRGQLDASGREILGKWESRELTGNRAAAGSWDARKRGSGRGRP